MSLFDVVAGIWGEVARKRRGTSCVCTFLQPLSERGIIRSPPSKKVVIIYSDISVVSSPFSELGLSLCVFMDAVAKCSSFWGSGGTERGQLASEHRRRSGAEKEEEEETAGGKNDTHICCSKFFRLFIFLLS